MSDTITRIFEYIALNADGLQDLFDEKFTTPLLNINEDVTAKVELQPINDNLCYVRAVVSAPKNCMGFVSKHMKATTKEIVETKDIPFTEAQLKKSYEDPDPHDKNAWKRRIVIPDDVWLDKTAFLIEEIK